MRNGKVALVTGSSKGIGAAIAVQLAKDGYDVAVHYSSSRLYGEEVAEEVVAQGVRCCLLQGDTGEADVPERLVAQTIEKLGRIDVLVNNAGITRLEALRDLTPEVMDQMFNTNYRGMLLGAKAAAKYMVEHGIKGVILFNTSVRSYTPHVTDGIYGGLKEALNRTIRSLAIDLGRYGIRVNGFAPGITNVYCTDPGEEQVNPFYRHSARFIPLRRNGYAQDMADVVSFLASEDSDYITGQTIPVDGGLSIVGMAGSMPDLFQMVDIADVTDAQGTDPYALQEANTAYSNAVWAAKDREIAERRKGKTFVDVLE